MHFFVTHKLILSALKLYIVHAPAELQTLMDDVNTERHSWTQCQLIRLVMSCLQLSSVRVLAALRTILLYFLLLARYVPNVAKRSI